MSPRPETEHIFSLHPRSAKARHQSELLSAVMELQGLFLPGYHLYLEKKTSCFEEMSKEMYSNREMGQRAHENETNAVPARVWPVSGKVKV